MITCYTVEYDDKLACAKIVQKPRVVGHPCTLHIVLFPWIHSNTLTCLSKRVYLPFQTRLLAFPLKRNQKTSRDIVSEYDLRKAALLRERLLKRVAQK